ncbi:MAG: hypothetical protein FD123_2719 [Bacteroidetes bacterium]|nr:MAG: hypothetical protein FD123_2719 [Bacteroidota bacterium]
MAMNMQTPRQILDKFYKDNRLGDDGGQSSSSVKIELAPKINLYFPNFDSRRKAVMKHDIHHLLTGYKTTLAGEGAISAWELASGCWNYKAAFIINLSGLMLGMLVNPLAVLRAFARGRRTKNLYADPFSNEEALDKPIGELQALFLLDKFGIDQKPGFADVLLLLAFLLLGLVNSLLSLVLLPFLVIYSLYVVISRKGKS